MLRMTLPTALVLSAVWHGLTIIDTIRKLRAEYRGRKHWRQRVL